MCSSVDFFVFSCIDSICNIGHKAKYQWWCYSLGYQISQCNIYVYNDRWADKDSPIEDLCLNIELISIYNSHWNIVSTREIFLVIPIVQYVRNYITSENDNPDKKTCRGSSKHYLALSKCEHSSMIKRYHSYIEGKRDYEGKPLMFIKYILSYHGSNSIETTAIYDWFSSTSSNKQIFWFNHQSSSIIQFNRSKYIRYRNLFKVKPVFLHHVDI